MQFCVYLKRKGLSVVSIRRKLAMLAFPSKVAGIAEEMDDILLQKMLDSGPGKVVWDVISGNHCPLPYWKEWVNSGQQSVIVPLRLPYFMQQFWLPFWGCSEWASLWKNPSMTLLITPWILRKFFCCLGWSRWNCDIQRWTRRVQECCFHCKHAPMQPYVLWKLCANTWQFGGQQKEICFSSRMVLHWPDINSSWLLRKLWLGWGYMDVSLGHTHLE